MFNFIFSDSEISQAVRYEKLFKFLVFFKKLFGFLFLTSFILFSLGFLNIWGEGFFLNDFLPEILGWLSIFLVFFIFAWINSIFFGRRLRNAKQKIKSSGVKEMPEKFNSADFLGFEAGKAIYRSIKFSSLKNIQITPDIFCYFLLKDNKNANFVFSRALIDLKAFLKNLKKQIQGVSQTRKSQEKYSKEFRDFIARTIILADKKGHERIEFGDALSCLAQELVFKQILVSANLSAQDIGNICFWLERMEKREEQRKRFWEKGYLARFGSIGRDWASGFSVTLDKYSIDWTGRAGTLGSEKIIGHKEEIEAIERVLSRSKINNVLLIGNPGSGRKSSVYALASRSLFGKGLDEINYKRVVELNLPKMLSILKSKEEVEETLNIIFEEVASAGNIILIINNFHDFVGPFSRPGVIDISGILGSYLQLPQFKVIAITSYEGLHEYIEQKPGLLHVFEKIEVSEISPNETIAVLEDIVFYFERKYKRFISYPAIRDIVFLSAKYFPNTSFPKKAIDILDEVMVGTSKEKQARVVLPKHVADIISQKSEVPVGSMKGKEKEILLNLEELIHKRIINQEEAVFEISSALRRARSEISIRKGPMGGFLFLGPTGVGKTETSKALTDVYFGSEERMIRLDMSEFQSISDIQRLIGAPGQEGLLTTKIKEDPFSLVLLDEIEKAHPDVLNLFKLNHYRYIQRGL